MGKILILAEKPQIGQALEKVLPGTVTDTKNGVIRKGNYIITWAFGHLLALKEPEDYNEEYKNWDLEQLPIFFENWGQKPGKDITKKGGQMSKVDRIKQIGLLLKESDMVINAADPDDEGQLLIDEILRWHHYNGPVKRINTSNLEPGALKREMQNLKDNREFENEGWSAYARSIADLMVGVNMSRYFSLKNNILLTIGRVQTPTLGLVIKRDEIIENHQKVFFYELFAKININEKEIETTYCPAKDEPSLTDGKMLNHSFLEEKEPKLLNQTFKNVVVQKKKEKESPPLPFNLVKLQSYCGACWGYSPAEVMQITQNLRENYKAITYNRTDCQYLSEEHFESAPRVINSAATNLGMNPELFDSKIKSRCFNDSKITAHHAIIPTGTKIDIQKLTPKEKNVYIAIAMYYLAQFLPPAEKEKTTLFIDLGNQESLQAVSTVIISPGYKKLLRGKKDEKDHSLSELNPGNYTGTVTSTEIREKETKPPARYTLHSLNEDMTRIAKYVDDPYIKQLLLEKDKDKTGENGSIGTAATRAPIIENLIKRGFIALKGKAIISTPLGRELYRILPDEIKKPDMTAKWWVIQEDIKMGKYNYQELPYQVLETIKRIIHTEYPRIDQSLLPPGTKGAPPKHVGKCPVCGQDVKSTPKGFFCSNEDCDFALWPEMKYYNNILKITESKAKSLLTKKRTLFKVKTKKGKDMEISLRIIVNDKYVNFEPDEKTEEGEAVVVGKCPKCGELVEMRAQGFLCSNSDCNFILWPTMKYFDNTLKITESKARTLLAGKKTTFSLKSKAGKKYDGYLRLKINGNYINFEPDGFPPEKHKGK